VLSVSWELATAARVAVAMLSGKDHTSGKGVVEGLDVIVPSIDRMARIRHVSPFGGGGGVDGGRELCGRPDRVPAGRREARAGSPPR
jgi:hypothetical protein